VADAACRQLYVDALRQIAASPAPAAIAAQARAIRAVVAPWRLLDPRREQTVAAGEAQADAKIATMEHDGRSSWSTRPSRTAEAGWPAAPHPAERAPRSRARSIT
jgi:hypothetical protein